MTLPVSARTRLAQRVLFAVGAGLIMTAGCQRKESSGPDAAKSPAATAAAAPVAAAEKVRGRWLRPDGGYVLAIGDIGQDGRAEAQYFNPSPINVAWTRVRTEGGVVKVDVELRDVNYPGCLYKLSYLPETDRLVGTYFQAQMQQTHEVAFVREPR